MLEWPANRELIRGRSNVVAVNAEYPEGWSIHVLGIHAAGDYVVSEVEVPQEGVGVFRTGRFWPDANTGPRWAGRTPGLAPAAPQAVLSRA